jgi:ankyrin repeat protein
VITALLSGGADVNARDSDKRTPLMLAVIYNRNSAAITALLEAGADARALDGDKESALDYAGRDPSLRETDAYRQLQEASRQEEEP